MKKNTIKLCLALDLFSKEENLSLCKNLYKNNINDIYLKIGLSSFIRDGLSFVKELQNLGFKIFLDLKLYDIPNTMLGAVDEMLRAKIDIFTIHASSGLKAMEMISKKIKDIEDSPLIFAVTALTSFSDIEFRKIYNFPLDEAVYNFAKISHECGIDGIVCSTFESKMIKDNFNLLTLTPAIRPSKGDFIDNLDLYNNKDDQQRVASINDAINQKVDFIVIGRPIYKSNDPILITKKILEKLNNLE